jgi:glycosyltransferase involved in cell wall biosynthesis
MKVKEILKDCSTWLPGSRYNSPDKPHISILLPTFKRAKNDLFRKAVNSVLNQTFQRWELIIIDDCSTDGTFDIIKECMSNDGRINCIRHSFNIGLPAISEYEGYRRAKGDYIAFLFDDCEWLPNALEDMYSFMIQNKTEAVYGKFRLISNEQEDFVEYGSSANPITYLYYNNFIANAAVLLHRKVIETVGLYDPHLSLIRICDWDLWKRIHNQFSFTATDILVGSERGYILSDILGNKFYRDPWVVAEHSNNYRNEKLLPDVFEEYDIFDMNGRRSEYFLKCMQGYADIFSGKQWFKKDDLSFLRLYSLEDTAVLTKRVLVVSDDISASIILCFSRIGNYNNIVIDYIRFGISDDPKIISSDIIVLVRRIDLVKNIPSLVFRFNLPVYYFIDDNFLELSSDNISKGSHIIEYFASLTTAENLKEFNGIILSSASLMSYYNIHRLHQNLILLKPVINEDSITTPQNDKGHVSLAFLGGSFRVSVLIEFVLPALVKISKLLPIKLFSPDLSIDLNKYENCNFSIITIPRELNLELVLRKYMEKDIDILIHCGPNIKNNIYKTENSLLNAVSLGAVLVASKFPPFVEESHEKLYLLAQNRVEDWYDKLISIINDKDKRKNIYLNARDYCLRSYSKKEALKNLVEELDKVPETTIYGFLKRLELYNQLTRENCQKINSADDKNKKNALFLGRPIESDYLIPSCNIISKCTYEVLCKSNTITKIYVIFASWETRPLSGRLVVNILYNEKVLRCATISLNDIILHAWTPIEFNSIKNCYGKIFRINFSIIYDKCSPLLFVYTDKRKFTFLYKILSKLKIPYTRTRSLYYTYDE